MFISFENKPADMSENNKKTLRVINEGSGNSKIVIRSPPLEINLGCGCGSASCSSCPGSLGIKAGSEKDVVYRNVFIYLTTAVVILIVTYTAKVVLTSLLV